MDIAAHSGNHGVLFLDEFAGASVRCWGAL